MSGSFPVYDSYSKCTEECVSMVSYCVGTSPLIVCQLNIVVFLACIFLAVCTGVAIPMVCLLCYVASWCTEAKQTRRRRRGSDEETVKLNPRSVQGMIHSMLHRMPSLALLGRKTAQLGHYKGSEIVPCVSSDEFYRQYRGCTDH
ncbi:unnamed protein product [Haemonchus placei]|uniref:Uncharacterized protein n=1 Tax=Haemonchus placei TaxID=6290 RepID=A0A0N4W5W8_HAEPC|nr:unnamed protein product [Haemonchus placei]